MVISWYGQSCVIIKGKEATLIIDPFDISKDDIKVSQITNGIITLSKEGVVVDEVAQKICKNGGKLFNWPGEYESQSVSIHGISHLSPSDGQKDEQSGESEGVMFTYIIDGINVAHLGRLNHTLTAGQLDAIGDIDVLFVPVGGGDVIDAKVARDITEKIEPEYVIPIMYSSDSSEKLASVEGFLKNMGKPDLEAVTNLKIKERNATSENIEVVLLKKS